MGQVLGLEASCVLRGVRQVASDEELLDTMREVDEDGSGRIDFDEVSIDTPGASLSGAAVPRADALHPGELLPC